MTDTSHTVLAMISQSPLSGQDLYEALSALMVLATYGQAVQILFVGDAISCLQQTVPASQSDLAPAFKSVQAMIESFEFYDLLPVWVADQPIPTQPLVDCVAVLLHQVNTQQFKAILTW